MLSARWGNNSFLGSLVGTASGNCQRPLCLCDTARYGLPENKSPSSSDRQVSICPACSLFVLLLASSPVN